MIAATILLMYLLVWVTLYIVDAFEQGIRQAYDRRGE
jgi:hypothetical protein